MSQADAAHSTILPSLLREPETEGQFLKRDCATFAEVKSKARLALFLYERKESYAFYAMRRACEDLLLLIEHLNAPDQGEDVTTGFIGSGVAQLESSRQRRTGCLGNCHYKVPDFSLRRYDTRRGDRKGGTGSLDHRANFACEATLQIRFR